MNKLTKKNKQKSKKDILAEIKAAVEKKIEVALERSNFYAEIDMGPADSVITGYWRGAAFGLSEAYEIFSSYTGADLEGRITEEEVDKLYDELMKEKGEQEDKDGS